MDLKKFIGSKMKELREKQGFTLDYVAGKLDTTRQTVSRYERGERQANQDVLFALSDLYNVSIDHFFPKKENTTNELERALSHAENLTADEIEFLHQLIEKTLSLDEDERKRFFKSMKFMIDHYNSLNED